MNAIQKRILRAVLECQMEALEAGGYRDDLDQVFGDVEDFLQATSDDARLLVALVLDAISLNASLAAPFEPFWHWAPARRREWLFKLPGEVPLVGKQLRDLLGVLLGLGWLIIYSRPAGRALVAPEEHDPIDPQTQKPAEPVSARQPPVPDLTRRYAVCIIGSGAGGAVVAARLAEAGVGPILMVESGKWVEPKDYPRRDDRALSQCYASGGVQPALSKRIIFGEFLDFLKHGRITTINVLQGRLVGGGPAINNAICFPMPSPAQRTDGPWAGWQAAGIPFPYADLAAAYRTISAELQLDPVGVDSVCGWRSAIFGLSKGQPPADVVQRWNKLVIAVFDCLGCGECNTGCRYGRKTGGLQGPPRLSAGTPPPPRSFLERALAKGVSIAPELQAERFVTKNGGVSKVVLRNLAAGNSIEVTAEVFVLAAGALASTAILAKSGLSPSLPIGRRASANVVTPVYGVIPDPQPNPNDPDSKLKDPGLQMCYFVGDEGKLIKETWFHFPGTIAASLPGWVEAHAACMRTYGQLACVGVVIPSGPTGSVDPEGRLFLKLDQAEFERLRTGLVEAANALFDAGATTVYLASKDPVVLSVADRANLATLLRQQIDEAGDLNLATPHPQGGNAISTNPALGVVDATFQVRGAAGLFVADASLFPAPCGVNPMLTTMALAHMAAAQVRAKFP